MLSFCGCDFIANNKQDFWLVIFLSIDFLYTNNLLLPIFFLNLLTHVSKRSSEIPLPQPGVSTSEYYYNVSSFVVGAHNIGELTSNNNIFILKIF